MLPKMRPVPILWLLISTVFSLYGQTQIDLRSQSRNVDFSEAQTVRPFKTGANLPATCAVGEMFFKTSAASGLNTYGCVATNMWALQGGGGATTGVSTSDFEAELNPASNTLTVRCSSGACGVQVGDTVTAYPSLNAEFRPQNGTYFAAIYFDGTGLHYGYPSGQTMSRCSGSCVAGITSFPGNVVPLYSIFVSGGVFQAGTLADLRTRHRAPKKVLTGSNIIIAETTDSITFSAPTTLRNQPSGNKPACSSATRGMFWHSNGQAGTKDTITVCAKDMSDDYQWRSIY